MANSTSKIVKAERHEKKSLSECHRCGKSLYPEKSWYIAWTDKQKAIAEGTCLAEEFLR